MWLQRIGFFVAGALVATACIYWYLDEIRTPQLLQQVQNAPAQQQQQGSAQIANPASVNCVNIGGTLEIRDEAQGQVGYCHLKDGRVCEEWGLFRDKTCNPPPQQ
jgi:putative hemolysin